MINVMPNTHVRRYVYREYIRVLFIIPNSLRILLIFRVQFAFLRDYSEGKREKEKDQ